ncbi:hypothetical protein [Kitasatospora sp. LaBMicrA B282]|uniref:hypothetical protein n=1 Tax=Kitasatospora sp. LaBMicrA B282 TaxID=3420949 RepID=UPI003D14A303
MTLQLDPAVAETVRLDPPADETTVRLSDPVDAEAITVRFAEPHGAPAEEVDTATLLADEVWHTPDLTVELAHGTVATLPLPADEQPDRAPEAASEAAFEAAPEPAPMPAGEAVPGLAAEPDADGLRRFGPGIPTATTPTPERVAELWHGTGPGQAARRRRRWLALLLPLLLVLALLGLFAWQRYVPALTVTGVSAHTDPAGPACGGTQQVIGTLDTDGRAGTVSYRWLRSDGTVSGTLSQPVLKGTHHTDVVLRWTFEGHGTMAATATLQVLSPNAHSATASFAYNCA